METLEAKSSENVTDSAAYQEPKSDLKKVSDSLVDEFDGDE